nr:MAG TPA: hypothetical protein [Caudoviricetes sp.]
MSKTLHKILYHLQIIQIIAKKNILRKMEIYRQMKIIMKNHQSKVMMIIRKDLI